MIKQCKICGRRFEAVANTHTCSAECASKLKSTTHRRRSAQQYRHASMAQNREAILALIADYQAQGIQHVLDSYRVRRYNKKKD